LGLLILCLARAIETLRIPIKCRAAFDAGRALFLSPFTQQPKRVTQESAHRRNEVVAALADEACIAHATAGGQTERMKARLASWDNRQICSRPRKLDSHNAPN